MIQPAIIPRPHQSCNYRSYHPSTASYPEFIFSDNKQGAGGRVFALGLDKKGRVVGLVYQPPEGRLKDWAVECVFDTLFDACEVKFAPFR